MNEKRKELLTRLGLSVLLEFLLFFLGALLCALLFGWRSPQTVLGFATLAWMAVNALFVFSYPIVRSHFDHPL